MAAQHNYTITFKSLRAGTVYTLTIGGSSGTTIPLKGGAQPFVTQEDDTDDMFAPVRTQSGYIRIVDDGYGADGITPFDWKDLLPETDTSRPVKLTTPGEWGTVILWQGFMQAQNFGGTLYGGTQEREFPVQCALASLAGTDVDGTNRELKNFAYIIKQAFDSLPGVGYEQFIFQGGSKARDMLMTLVDWQNLVTAESGSLTGRYDNLQTLTDICQFWGWTARVCGDTVYFTCADDATLLGDALSLTYLQLNALASGTAEGSVVSGFLVPKTLTGNIFASMNNEETLVRGYNEATVTADGNEADTAIMEAWPESVENIMKNNGSTYTVNYGNGVVGYYSSNLLTFNSSYLSGSAVDTKASLNIVNFTKSGQADNIVDIVRVLKSYIRGTVIASLQTTFHHVYPGKGTIRFGTRPKGLRMRGTAYFKGEKYENYSSSGMGKKTMYMRLGIGTSRNDAQWWNGSSWQSSVAEFTVALGSDEDILKSVKTVSGLTVYTEVMPLPESPVLHGLLFVDFLGSSDMPEYNEQRAFDLANFGVEYVTDSSNRTIWGEENLDGSREYKATNNSTMDGEWAADLIYASNDNLARGYGLLINPSDYTLMEAFVYAANTSQHPEQHLVNRVSNYYKKAKRRVSAELKSDIVGEFSPRNTATLDSTTGHVVSINHDWRDDVVRIVTMEI